MKLLDVDLLQDGLTRHLNKMNQLEKEMTAIHQAVEKLTTMEDALKGEGGQAIRNFYTSCHLPFLQYFFMFKEEFHTVLQQAQQALASLEPVDAGHIVEAFLENEVEKGLTESAEITATLTDEANAIMDEVADIVSLPKLHDTLVQESVMDARAKRDDTIEALHIFDRTQTNQLVPIESSIQSMKEWVQNIEGLFKEGLTDVDFPTDKWSSMAVESEITMKLTAMGLSVGHFLSQKEASVLIEQSIKQKVMDDEDLTIAGTYYTLPDGRIVRKFMGSCSMMYTFVDHMPKQKKVEENTEVRGKWGIWGYLQLGIDVVGLIPVLGEPADLLNGTIYAIRGDEVNAALSFASAVPFVGYAGTVGKVAYKTTDIASVKNVVNPKKFESDFQDTYQSVVNGPISNTQIYMDIHHQKNYLQIPSNQFKAQIAQPKNDVSKTNTKGTGKVEINYPLSSTNKKHINKHNIESIKQQSKYLSDSQLADKLESSFFNPNWSKDDINKYAEIAYNDLKSQGKTGNLTYEIGGEIIDVFIHPDGQFGSVYGRHKFKVEDIRKMTKQGGK